MPYSKTSQLPENVKNTLPTHAKHIYQDAFNSAWDQYDDPEERQAGKSREQTAHSVAWAAVKKKYEKRGGEWKKI